MYFSQLTDFYNVTIWIFKFRYFTINFRISTFDVISLILEGKLIRWKVKVMSSKFSIFTAKVKGWSKNGVKGPTSEVKVISLNIGITRFWIKFLSSLCPFYKNSVLMHMICTPIVVRPCLLINMVFKNVKTLISLQWERYHENL